MSGNHGASAQEPSNSLGLAHRQTIDHTSGGSVIRALLNREFIKAKRTGSLFRLGRHESGFVYLALRLNVRFASLQLMRAAVAVLKRMKEVGDEAYSRVMRGMRMAWAFSEAAVDWGNAQAKAWRDDSRYSKYLGIHMSSGGPL